MRGLAILILFLSQISFTQSSIVKETINRIEFKQDTIKAVFEWITDNIKYDVNKLNEIKRSKKGRKSNNKSSYKNEEEHQNELLKRVIKKQKCVCEDYSLLFNAIVSELGYESYIVVGYTKNSKGRVNRGLGHAWNIVKVNGKLNFYDLTWGSGYVSKKGKFVKEYSQKWYNVDSEEMIKTHMPFDPIWQLLNNPISYKDFESNLENGISEDNYNYEHIIQIHKEKEKQEQMQDQVNRSTAMGEGIRLIDKWRKNISRNIDIYGMTSQIDLLEEANENSKRSVKLFNEYIRAKNKRFKEKKWTIEYTKQNLDSVKELVKSVIILYKSIKLKDRKTNNSINKAIKLSEKLLKQIEDEFIFIEKL